MKQNNGRHISPTVTRSPNRLAHLSFTRPAPNAHPVSPTADPHPITTSAKPSNAVAPLQNYNILEIKNELRNSAALRAFRNAGPDIQVDAVEHDVAAAQSGNPRARRRALRARTGGRLLFGVSFGGLVALRAAHGNPAFDAVAVYEPGVSVSGSIPVDWIDRARREVSEGANFEAFVTFVRGTTPGQTGRLPRRLLGLILRRVIPRAELQQNLALIPQAINEHIEVGRLDGRLADYRDMAAATLIMRGKERDTSRQAVALARLAEAIPHSQTATFRKLDHFAPEKQPGEIADAILRFFAAHARPGVQIEG